MFGLGDGFGEGVGLGLGGIGAGLVGVVCWARASAGGTQASTVTGGCAESPEAAKARHPPTTTETQATDNKPFKRLW